MPRWRMRRIACGGSGCVTSGSSSGITSAVTGRVIICLPRRRRCWSGGAGIAARCPRRSPAADKRLAGRPADPREYLCYLPGVCSRAVWGGQERGGCGQSGTPRYLPGTATGHGGDRPRVDLAVLDEVSPDPDTPGDRAFCAAAGEEGEETADHFG